MNILWTDGSAEPNPGKGGYAVIEQINDEIGLPVSLGKEDDTTNIRMEGMALIHAIKYTKDRLGGECEIHTDSEFWINVLTKWAPTWEENDWKKKNGPIKNLDIVQELYELYKENDVKLVWERGHVGTKFNELADEWANKARLGAGPDEIKEAHNGVNFL